MQGRWKLSPAPIFALVLSLCASGVAAGTRYVETTGTASGQGKATITIETNGLAVATIATYVIDVTIPNGSSATSSTIKIRDSLDVGLPVEFVVTVCPVPYSNFARIDYTTDGFDMPIVENVPGQLIQEASAPPAVLPMFGVRSGTILPGLVLLTAGVFFLVRRERRGSRAAAT